MTESYDSPLCTGARIVFDEEVGHRRLLWRKGLETLGLVVVIPLRRLASVWPGVRPAELIVEFVIRDERSHYRPAYQLQIGGDNVQCYSAETLGTSLADPLGSPGAPRIEVL